MFPSYLEYEKPGSCYFEPDHHCCSIWSEKKVDPFYLQTKKCSSQLLGARKKIMTYIKSQKNWFTASSSTKKMFLSYLEEEKTGSQLFRA